MKRIASLLLAACLLAAPQLTGKAQAEGFALSDFGARGTALAGGMVARADDPSAVAWNPAGITQLPGTQIMVGMTAIQPSGTVDTVDRFGIGRSTDVDKHTWANPHAYLTHQFSDNLWGGIGIFSRFGLGNSYPTNWPGRENLKYVSLKTVSLNPNLAFKINDNLSLAVGLEFMYATMLMKKDADLGGMVNPAPRRALRARSADAHRIQHRPRLQPRRALQIQRRMGRRPDLPQPREAGRARAFGI